jgi:hypothetical protein
MGDKTKILISTGLVGFGIISYSKYRCKNSNFTDPLTRGSSICSFCDGWSISHFLFYMLLGYKFPKELVFTMILGLIWESVEWATSHTNWKILSSMRGVSQCNVGTDTIGDHWFYAKFSDLILNFLGFMIGIKLKRSVE